MSEKQEYILVVGEIVFHEEDKPEVVNAIRSNGVILSDNTNLGVYAMGKAQQVLQANFFKKLGTHKVTVLDVVLMNFIRLGRMTAEEFQRTPEGMKLQERAPEIKTGDALDQAIAAAGGTANDA